MTWRRSVIERADPRSGSRSRRSRRPGRGRRAVEVRAGKAEVGAFAGREVADHLAAAMLMKATSAIARVADVRHRPDDLPVLRAPRRRTAPGSCSTMPVARTASNPKTRIARPRRCAGSPWSTSTSLGGAAAPSRCVDIRADERIGLDGQVVGRPIGRDDPGVRVDGRRAALGRGADDGDLVHDHVAALHRAADAVRARAEDHDEERRGDPGQLAAVDPSQDEVADRADEQDVGDDHHQQELGRRHVERGQRAQRAAHRVLHLLAGREAAAEELLEQGVGRQQPRPEAGAPPPAAELVGRQVGADEDDATGADRAHRDEDLAILGADQRRRAVAQLAGGDRGRRDRRLLLAGPCRQRGLRQRRRPREVLERQEVGERRGPRPASRRRPSRSAARHRRPSARWRVAAPRSACCCRPPTPSRRALERLRRSGMSSARGRSAPARGPPPSPMSCGRRAPAPSPTTPTWSLDCSSTRTSTSALTVPLGSS